MTDNHETKEEWYHSRAGWIEVFKKNYKDVRALVDRFCGKAEELDKFMTVGVDESAAHYEALWTLLQDTWEAAPDASGLHSLLGWSVLCDLCSEGPILWEDLPGGAAAVKQPASKGTSSEVGSSEPQEAAE